MRDFLRKRRLATRDPCRRWNHLLAHLRNNAIQRTKPQAAALRRTESDGIGNPLQEGRLDGNRDRQDRSASASELVTPSRISALPRPGASCRQNSHSLAWFAKLFLSMRSKTLDDGSDRGQILDCFHVDGGKRHDGAGASAHGRDQRHRQRPTQGGCAQCPHSCHQ
jgi:hypothetical protein